MRVCTRCNTPYPDTVNTCARDGSTLTTLSNILEERKPLPQEDHCGQIVGNYRLHTRLGVGGMGAVYQGTHAAIGKEVAVKILREDQARDESLMERFLREARSVAKIGNENVIQISDFGCTPEGRAYIVMELLTGRSLENVLEKDGALAFPRALKVAIQICSGLEAAHAQNIVHRDLKPDNIFLVPLKNDPEFVKILDFGIAKEVVEEKLEPGEKKGKPKRGLTQARQLIGTPLYMAPEQGSPEADARVDIYALGVILYRMVTGKLPFDSDNPLDILYKHLTQAPTPPIELRPDLPAELNALILQCLAKTPQERVPSATALSQRLFEIGGFQHAYSASGSFMGLPGNPPSGTFSGLAAAVQSGTELQKIHTAVADHPKHQTTLSASIGEIAAPKAAPPKNNRVMLFAGLGGALVAGAVAVLFFIPPQQKNDTTTVVKTEVSAPLVVPEKITAPASAPVVSPMSVPAAPVVENTPDPKTKGDPKKIKATKDPKVITPEEPVVIVPTPVVVETPKDPLEDPNTSLGTDPKKKKKKSLTDADPGLE
jgi:serine/threonine protein kinase